MKIFTTQLQGLLAKNEPDEDTLEDAARIICQAITSDGDLYIWSEGDLAGLSGQALSGSDPLKNCRELTSDHLPHLSPLDTLILASADRQSPAGKNLVQAANHAGTRLIGITSDAPLDENHGAPWTDKADVVLSNGVKQGLIPQDDGSRIGTPHLLAALYLYYPLYFAVTEILEDIDETD
ncbi:DUF2529 family protein [Salisediminibacterium halotolerans]|uniref:DUF2529 domain-containing protein n=1 Tax=Salisediminibacterium halotolerans TaxID=517425 RepID=A0A1H9QT67_9BACI|nr:DUF2529 family protein [Salisediminibacterium haloalkalitolerans]SER63577.1 protein of unknown function [Salisediminibacterium haloalkalitolerans]